MDINFAGDAAQLDQADQQQHLEESKAARLQTAIADRAVALPRLTEVQSRTRGDLRCSLEIIGPSRGRISALEGEVERAVGPISKLKHEQGRIARLLADASTHQVSLITERDCLVSETAGLSVDAQRCKDKYETATRILTREQLAQTRDELSLHNSLDRIKIIQTEVSPEIPYNLKRLSLRAAFDEFQEDPFVQTPEQVVDIGRSLIAKAPPGVKRVIELNVPAAARFIKAAARANDRKDILEQRHKREAHLRATLPSSEAERHSASLRTCEPRVDKHRFTRVEGTVGDIASQHVERNSKPGTNYVEPGLLAHTNLLAPHGRGQSANRRWNLKHFKPVLREAILQLPKPQFLTTDCPLQKGKVVERVSNRGRASKALPSKAAAQPSPSSPAQRSPTFAQSAPTSAVASGSAVAIAASESAATAVLQPAAKPAAAKPVPATTRPRTTRTLRAGNLSQYKGLGDRPAEAQQQVTQKASSASTVSAESDSSQRTPPLVLSREGSPALAADSEAPLKKRPKRPHQVSSVTAVADSPSKKTPKPSPGPSPAAAASAAKEAARQAAAAEKSARKAARRALIEAELAGMSSSD